MKFLFLSYKYLVLSIIISLLAFVSLDSFVLAQSPTNNSSTEPTKEQIIASLNEALAEISSSIENSPDVSVEERVELYLSLIEVSRAILSLQKVNRVSLQSTEEVVRPEGELSREEVNLYKVAAQLDSETLQAELTYYYTEDVSEIEDGSVYVEYEEEVIALQLDLPSEEISTFEERVEYATLQIIDEVVRETNVVRKEVTENVLVSSYNPIRDVRQSRENMDSYAQLLFDDFGTYSIIENITVFSGGNGSSIVITTDQDELLSIGLTEIIPEGRGGRAEEPGVRAANPEDALYSFGYDFYSTSINQVTERERGESPVVIPTISVAQTNIEYEDILDVLVGFFGEMPFAEGIDEIAEQTLEFLVRNSAVMIYSEDALTAPTQSSNHSQQCISETDVLVMNEVLLQLVESLRAQIIVSEDAISYHVPFRSERTSGLRCSGVRSHF